jgi:hypothetical protein
MLLDQAAVEPVAAFHVDQAGAVAGTRQIFVLKEVAQAPVGRHHLVAMGGKVRLRQPCPLRLRNRVRKGADGRGEGGVLRLLLQQVVDLLDHVADGQLGVDHAGRETLAKAGDDAVDHRPQLIVAGEIVLVIVDRLERCDAPAGGEHGIEIVEPAEVIDRPHQEQRENVRGEARQILFAGEAEHVVAQAVGGVQRRPVDPAQCREVSLDRRSLGRHIFIAEVIAELVRIGEIAAAERGDRVAAQGRSVAGREDGAKPLALGVRGGRRGGGRCPGGDGGGAIDGGAGGGAQQEHEQGEAGHVVLGSRKSAGGLSPGYC